jgi:hypothetical protein
MIDRFGAEGYDTAGDLEARVSDLLDDSDFHAIDQQMSPFNLFEAMGAIRAELRHSNFLAYLLSPSRPHGLGARPLASVLRALLNRLPAPQRPIMTLEIIAGEIDDAIVYREKDNIDILIVLPSLRFVVAIENKIDAKASEGQLERYREHLKSEFPDYRRLLIFLTPDGSDPGHDSFLAYSYADLVDTLQALIADTRGPVQEDTQVIVRHYVEMVRRHIVQDERLRALALVLYERHKEAFEFIFGCRPEPQSLLTVARQQVLSVQGLVEDKSSGNIFRFLPAVWNERLTTIKGDPTQWTRTGRGILFEIKTYADTPGRVNVALILGPGDPNVRTRVYQAVAAQPKLFTGLVKPMGTKWATIFSRDLLTSNQAKNLSFEHQSTSVVFQWSEFQAQALQALTNAVLAIDEHLAIPNETG